MADSGKTEHISEPIMERFTVRALSEIDLANVARHLTGCLNCQAKFVSTLRRQRGDADLSFTLAPEFWLRHNHLNYDQLLNLADDKSDATDRAFIDDHLKVCPPCQEDVRSLLEFRQQIAPEMRVSYAPVGEEIAHERSSWVSWWHGLARKPAYTTAAVLMGIAAVIASALLLRPAGNQNQQTQQVPTHAISPSVGSDDRNASFPSPSVAPNGSPEKPRSDEPVVALNDQGRTITVDRAGNVSGLDDIPAQTRDEIAKALSMERLDRPSILKELAGEDATLRGSQDAQLFKLLSPSRTVIISNRPTLKWEKAARATSYRVYVTDQAGNEVAKSQELSSGSTAWVLSKPLKRGGVYTWTVVAVVDGKEVVSPGPAAPEMKFKVLSPTQLQQLNQIKKTSSHLALGVFYTKFGMISEAEREFQVLVQHNPGSGTSVKFLRQIQSWKRR